MLRRILIQLINFYRSKISPYTKPKCRFYPTCSEYALVAIERFGVFKGLILALWRFLRCNPLCTPGYDPVPEKNNNKKIKP